MTGPAKELQALLGKATIRPWYTLPEKPSPGDVGGDPTSFFALSAQYRADVDLELWLVNRADIIADLIEAAEYLRSPPSAVHDEAHHRVAEALDRL